MDVNMRSELVYPSQLMSADCQPLLSYSFFFFSFPVRNHLLTYFLKLVSAKKRRNSNEDILFF